MFLFNPISLLGMPVPADPSPSAPADSTPSLSPSRRWPRPAALCDFKQTPCLHFLCSRVCKSLARLDSSAVVRWNGIMYRKHVHQCPQCRSSGKPRTGTSLVVQCLGIRFCNAEDAGSIPGSRAKIRHAAGRLGRLAGAEGPVHCSERAHTKLRRQVSHN